jgi:predicted metal-dependent hydrolase
LHLQLESTKSNKLDSDDQELTDELLRTAIIYTASRKTFSPTLEEIHQRANEKNIPFNDARKELRKESRLLQGKMVAHARKLRKPKLSKDLRKKLGVKGAGRPKGKKNRTENTSKNNLYRQLKDLVNKNNKAGIETTQKDAAKKLDLGGDRQLRRLLTGYGEKKGWKALVAYLLTE